ncbi:MAG: hypothetical protein ACLFQE_04570 [Thermotogota bacterium]
MKWAVKKTIDLAGWPILAFSAGLWLGSINISGGNVLVASSFWGYLIRILISAVGVYMVFWSYRSRDVFFEASQGGNLNVSVSPEVFRTLISRVLDNFDTVDLKTINMRPSKLEGVNELLIEISTTDPFSLSEVLKELYDKVSLTIKDSLGDQMGINVNIKVRSFEVNRYDA